MKDKFEAALKLFPALTLACYVCGFIVYNTHLSQYNIVDISIFNIKYIVAGILYLFIAALLIGPIYSWTQKGGRQDKWESIGYILAYSLFTFLLYKFFFYSKNADYSILISYSVILFVSIASYFVAQRIASKALPWSDIPLYVFLLGVAPLFIFGLNFKNIKKEVGGGEPYKKVLVLERPINGIVPVDSMFCTDTLTIVHENESEVFFYTHGALIGIKRNLIVGEILIAD